MKCRGGEEAALDRLARATLLAFALATHAVSAGSPVVRVKDGDSLVILSGGRKVEVRLAYIDAPELKQTYGRRAGAALRSLVGHRRVDLELISGDVHGRIVARVLRGTLDVNAEMVRRGFAWVRREFRHPHRLARLEDQARAARRGLWSGADPVPPWIWRKSQRGKKVGARERATADGSKRTAATPRVPAVRCGTKRYCRQMTSCEEARAYLQRCGLNRLDGDRDGVPCEKLCRR